MSQVRIHKSISLMLALVLMAASSLPAAALCLSALCEEMPTPEVAQTMHCDLSELSICCEEDETAETVALEVFATPVDHESYCCGDMRPSEFPARIPAAWMIDSSSSASALHGQRDESHLNVAIEMPMRTCPHTAPHPTPRIYEAYCSILR